MPNIELHAKKKVSSFRMIAMGTWQTAKDPSVYGSMDLPMDKAMDYLAEYREKSGRRLTISHMMCKAMAGVLEEIPDANAMIRFNKLYLREDVAIFFQVAMEDPETGQIDLSGVTVHRANKKSLPNILDEFEREAAKVRAGKDKDKEQTRQTFKKMPGWLVGYVLDLISLLTYTLNIDLSWAGIPTDVFGSMMVTNVGSLGLDTAFVPLVPYSKVPLLVALGALKKVPVVNDQDEIVIQKQMGLYVTFDHRVLDGSHASKMSAVLRKWFADPYTYFGPIPETAAK
ncbi:MAG: 2-oxo acid dehydrogenase [Rhodobacterales bacterium]|nr:2-oxo acid dehydrogenase [Rhodobacterales bacterium]